MRALFDATDASCEPVVDMWKLGKSLGFSRQETSDVQRYLQQEGLVENFALGGAIRLTHQGLCEVEASIDEPDEPTAHFPVEVIQNVTTYHGPVVNQSGSYNTANVTHNVGVSDKLVPIIESIRQIATRLEPAQQDEVRQLVEVVESEARSPKPKLAMLKTAIKCLTEFVKSAAALAAPVAELAKLVLPP